MAPGKRKAAEADPETEQANKLRSVCKAMDDSAAEFCCPITQELPIDPVTAEDGRVYERSAIEEWLEKNEKSPHTNEPMGKKLLPALQVKNMIASMVKSGALSGDKCAAWTLKLEQEKEVEEKRQQAEAGDADAMAYLAFCYRDGTHGLAKDLVSCFQWVSRAADLDHPAAMTVLGECYLNGWGTAKKVHTALIKLAQAAMLGSEHACFRLAQAYRVGYQGVEKDDTQMAYWQARMQSVARNGKCDASEELRKRVASWRPGGLTAE
jgi:hypothetical protein